MSNKTWYIRNLDIFEGIPKEEIMQISQQVREEVFPARTTLYSPHELTQQIFLVKEGEVHLYHTRDGKRTIFDVAGPGTLFGNFDPTKVNLNHFAEARPGTRICIFSVEDFLKIVSAYPEVMLRTLKHLSARLADYEEKIASTSADAKQKIMTELKRYKEKRFKSFDGTRSDEHFSLTHEQIAHLTGLNRVTVTRTLHELEKEGYVAIDKKTRAIFI